MKHRALRRLLVLSFQLTLLFVLSGKASAEIIDDIYLKTDANGEVDAVIKFSVPIHYSRYFPLRKSPDAAIYFNVLGSVPRNEWQNYETHRSPPSDVVRGFTVTTRDLSTGPKIEVQFFSPVEFNVTAGKDDRSILIHIKPDVVQQRQEEKPAGIPGGGAIACRATCRRSNTGYCTALGCGTTAGAEAGDCIPTRCTCACKARRRGRIASFS